MVRGAVTCFHICGTCRMVPASNKMAVVDQRGRVHGLEGVMEADASLMPDLVSAPISPAVLVIGERMVDLVKQGIQEGQENHFRETYRAAFIFEEFMTHSPTVDYPFSQRDFRILSRIG